MVIEMYKDRNKLIFKENVDRAAQKKEKQLQ